MTSDEKSPVELSILIVSYNTVELTRRCLVSVFATVREPTFEVVVVDNASADGSAEMIERGFPRARLIRSPRNLGFGAGMNVAARAARGGFLLLLNPDTVALPGAIERLLSFAKAHPTAGIVGGRTIFEDGRTNPTSFRSRPTPWSMFCQGSGLSALFRGSRLFDPASTGALLGDEPREVDVVTGCFFLVARSLWERLGGFDPTFFMYGEETDFCLRARALGFRPTVTPEAVIVHVGSASERVRADKMVRLFAAHTTLFRKHWSPVAARFGVGMLRLWALTRLAGNALAVSPRHRAGLAQWREIWRRRDEWVRGFPPAATREPAPRPTRH